MEPPAAPAPEPAAQPTSPPRRAPHVRVSDRDRDAVLTRMQEAFADGRLDDDEFDQRTRAALTARTAADLDRLTEDLPTANTGTARRPGPATSSRAPGKWVGAYKGPLRRGGRWRVPARLTTVVYKGSGLLDLRAAELSGPETTIVAVAYKSRIDILVPPGLRVEMEGFGVSKGWSAQEDLESLAPRDAPVLRIRGIAYKGTIEARTRPAAH